MAYTWTNGEVITAEKLNNTGGILVVHMNLNDGILIMDKTWSEITNAAKVGLVVAIYEQEVEGGLQVNNNMVTNCLIVPDTELPYQINVGIMFSTDSADGYPSASFNLDEPIGELNPPIGELNPIGEIG